MSKTLFIVIMMKQVRRFVGDVNGFVSMTCGELCLNLRPNRRPIESDLLHLHTNYTRKSAKYTKTQKVQLDYCIIVPLNNWIPAIRAGIKTLRLSWLRRTIR